MSENQYSPLTQTVVRTLTDKLYEKRKAAALEIEKQTKELIKSNNMADVEKIISVLEQLTTTPNGNMRKGGLIGLAATAIALGSKHSAIYAVKLLEPVFTCFLDHDSRVRYFACESLYNIVKVCRASVLVKFDELFNILWNLSSDPDQNVRNGSELLDRLLFSILTVPDFSVSEYFPEVLDGVFKALEDPSPAVHEITISVLTEMQNKLDPKRSDNVKLEGVINVLVIQATSQVPIVRDIAIQWLNQINIYYGDKILPSLPSFLISILPYLFDNMSNDFAGSRPLSLPNDLNQRLTSLVKTDSQIPVEAVVEVLLAHLRHERTETRVATLNWIRHLHSTNPTNMFRYMDRFFPVLLDLLSDPTDEVLMLDIILITDICGQPKQQQQLDIRSLKLGDELNQELKTISPYLVKFNIALLKIELFPLRQRLRNPDQSDSTELFQNLYKCWCNQPICLLSLYLLSQNYQSALELIPRLSDIDITMELLIEIDRIVQLIESPILAYVRMDLLHPDYQKPLTALLSALLMLLPQSEAFSILHKRLQAVPHLAVLESMKKSMIRGAGSSFSPPIKIKFKELIQYFDRVTQVRSMALRVHHKKMLEEIARQKSE
uniref:Protein VAC14 homolog n=1 Tax=Meloidogyne javanica TaxID=6303 RepID=A0A915N8W2_MELJA